VNGNGATALRLIADLDALFRAVLTDPVAWDQEAFARWAADAVDPDLALSRPMAREFRRGIRQAVKLQRFWAERRDAVPDDWRQAVDEALGGPGWRPSLALARIGLEADPSPELFEEVAWRFRVATFQPFMDGIDFETWLAARSEPPPEAGQE
jgi:hypothetical protein